MKVSPLLQAGESLKGRSKPQTENESLVGKEEDCQANCLVSHTAFIWKLQSPYKLYAHVHYKTEIIPAHVMNVLLSYLKGTLEVIWCGTDDESSDCSNNYYIVLQEGIILSFLLPLPLADRFERIWDLANDALMANERIISDLMTNLTYDLQLREGRVSLLKSFCRAMVIIYDALEQNVSKTMEYVWLFWLKYNALTGITESEKERARKREREGESLQLKRKGQPNPKQCRPSKANAADL